jgi:antirestriction protein ArdC
MDNSAAYIGSWLTRLRNDPTLVVHAAAQAQKAVDFILGTVEVQQEHTYAVDL